MHLAGPPETAVACHGRCRAAQTCPSHCERPCQPSALHAGQTGHLATWRFDRFGNRITSAAREVPFLAIGSGPGSIRTQVMEVGNGSLEIRYVHMSVEQAENHSWCGRLRQKPGGRQQQGRPRDIADWGCHTLPICRLGVGQAGRTKHAGCKEHPQERAIRMKPLQHCCNA